MENEELEENEEESESSEEEEEEEEEEDLGVEYRYNLEDCIMKYSNFKYSAEVNLEVFNSDVTVNLAWLTVW